ncbi:MAG TPA: hypothetical protein VGK73_24655, partial [Polyangiaceae bacterium]
GVFTTAFEGTTSYATLNLDNTGLTDLTELANAEGLVHNLVIYLRNNPVDCEAQAENIARLRARVALVDICPTL